MLDLKEPFASALDQALAYIHATWSPVAIIVSGSIIRGDGNANSDLDLVVVHDQPWRQRVQMRFNGVPAEMFVNPAFEIQRGLPRDAAGIRPVMPHMIATGTIVHDPEGIAEGLQNEARQILKDGPNLTAESMTILKYGTVTDFEDAEDLATTDPDRARMLLLNALDRVAVLAFVTFGQWPPRTKELLSRLPEIDSPAADLIRQMINEPSIRAALDLAAPLVERYAGATRFFAWSGAPQELTP